MSQQLSDVGVVGLCSGGRELALRLAAGGWRVSLWDAAFYLAGDASAGSAMEFLAAQGGTRGGLVAYANCEDFIESLNTPRRVVVFDSEAGRASAFPRSLLDEMDRLLEYPADDEGIPFDDLAQLELTLLFQIA